MKFVVLLVCLCICVSAHVVPDKKPAPKKLTRFLRNHLTKKQVHVVQNDVISIYSLMKHCLMILCRTTVLTTFYMMRDCPIWFYSFRLKTYRYRSTRYQQEKTYRSSAVQMAPSAISCLRCASTTFWTRA